MQFSLFDCRAGVTRPGPRDTEPRVSLFASSKLSAGAGPLRRVRVLAAVGLLVVVPMGAVAQKAVAQKVVNAPVNVAYATQPTPIYGDSALKQQIGVMTPGSPISLSKDQGSGGQPFSMDGWFQQGNRNVLFLGEGKRIVMATLPGSPTAFQELGEAKDEYDTVWVHARIRGFILPKSLTRDQATVWQRAAKLYQSRCSACHAVHKPTEFTANQWPGILKIMAKNAALQPDEAALITEYLQTHAKP